MLRIIAQLLIMQQTSLMRCLNGVTDVKIAMIDYFLIAQIVEFFTIVFQLTDEERVYMNAAALGDVPIIRQSLEETDTQLNVNCVDYMGRSALHLAVDSENFEAIELLLDRLQFECIEESLLHTISKGATKIVKVGK